jgi:chromosome segregation ATPase
LRKWKEVQDAGQGITSKENLPDSLLALIKGLWESLVTQSSEQFLLLEEQYKKEISELMSELEKYKSNNQRWQKLFNQWQQEKIVLANEKLTLEQALEFAQKENQTLHNKHDGILQKLQEKQERITELHRLHQQVQNNLEHYRESAREQRLIDQQTFEREKQQLQLDIKNKQEQLINKQDQYSDLLQQKQFLQQSYVELEKKCHESTTSAQSMAEKINRLEKINIEYQYTNQHFQQQCKELEAKVENKISELMMVQSDNKILKQQLVDIKHVMSDVQDQHKFLANEKWVLAQEKAQLEGQLKQMQSIMDA